MSHDLLTEPVIAVTHDLLGEEGMGRCVIDKVSEETGSLLNSRLSLTHARASMVRINTLGEFRLAVDGKPLASEKTATHRPIQLLKALITFGGKDVSQEKLIDTLWPEGRGDSALASFNTTLYRLRKLIGSTKAIRLKDGHVSLNTNLVWVDICSLKSALFCIDNELAEPAADARVIEACWLHIKKLYRGSFLEHDVTQPWALAVSEKTDNRLKRLALELGAFWEEQGMPDKAIECYQCGIEVDFLAEIFYQKLMRIFISQGRYAEAMGAYGRCRRNLMLALNIMPGAKTVDLYRSIPVCNTEM